MRNFNKLPVAVAFAGASLLGMAGGPEAAAQDLSAGNVPAVSHYILGLDGSGQPDVSSAPNGYDTENPLRFHQGGELEVTSVCDTTTGEGTSQVKLTTVARKGEEYATVTWGMQHAGKEFYRQELGGGKTAIIPNVPSGLIDIAWFEDMDIEGADVDDMTVFDAVQTLEGLVDDGTITDNTRDDFRSYSAKVEVPECEKDVPETTTTTSTTITTTTVAPTTSTTTSTTVPETTTTTSTTVPEETTTTTTSTTTQPEVTTTTEVKTELIPPLCVATRATGEVVEVDCGAPLQEELAVTGGNIDTELAFVVDLFGLGGLLMLAQNVRQRRLDAQLAPVRTQNDSK